MPADEPSADRVADAEGSELRRGTSVGRYVILERVGAGGMGVVYAAYDPELNRRLAIKLLHRSAGPTDDGSDRLLREAQAMALVAHPNVIAVHDVGTVGSSVFVAMEFVEGQTLSAWLSAEKRRWRDILRVFVQAGRGLAAAHTQNVVHRDFKPDNVLIGGDGRVRVLDFGLARATSEDSSLQLETLEDTKARPQRDALATPLTRTGSVMGTPAYMAPEQFLGRPADERSDQFSFCVALYEALYGRRPFDGGTMASLAFQVTQGNVREPPASVRLPGWVRRALVRGLATDPGDRFVTMDALLSVLDRDPRRSAGAWAVAVVGIAAAGTAIVALQDSSEDIPRRCTQGRDKFAEIWNDDTRRHIARVFSSTGVSHADETWSRAARWLGEYAEQWVQMHTDACEATHMRGEQSEDLLDRRMVCLERRRTEYEAVVNVLAAADAKVVEKAIQTVSDMRSLAPCADTEALLASVAPPKDPAIALEVEALRAELAQARALHQSGKFADGREVAASVLARAEQLGYAPLSAEATLRLGRLESELGDYDLAHETTRQAFFLASDCGHDNVTLEAANSLAFLRGYKAAQPEEGRLWVRHAEAALRRLGKTTVDDISVLHNLASLLERQGRYEEALSYQQRILEVKRERLPPDHPSFSFTLASIAGTLVKLGRVSEAKGQYETAIELRVEALGPNHPDVAHVRRNYGVALEAERNYEGALQQYRSALETMVPAVGEDHPTIALTLNNIAAVLQMTGRYSESRAYFLRAIRMWERKLGLHHPNIGAAVEGLGNIARDEGRLADAERHYRHSLDNLERSLGPEHPVLAYPLAGLGDVHLRAGANKDAETALRRALALGKAAAKPGEIPRIQFALARAIVAEDRPEAERLAREAIEAYSKAGASWTRERRAVEEWLGDGTAE